MDDSRNSPPENKKPVTIHRRCGCLCGCAGESDEQYFTSFPEGWKFAPTEQQLISYLSKKVLNQALPPNKIKPVDLYNYNPEQLIGQYKVYAGEEENEWFFFTPRERKYRNGSRPKRKAGEGYWKATGVDKEITSKGKKVGSKKTLVYYVGKPPKGSKTNYIMHEFVLHRGSNSNPEANNKNTTDHMTLDEWVLCRIHKKADRSLKKNDDQSMPNESDSTAEDQQMMESDYEEDPANSTTIPPSIEPTEEEACFRSDDETGFSKSIVQAHTSSDGTLPQGPQLECPAPQFIDPFPFMGDHIIPPFELSQKLLFKEIDTQWPHQQLPSYYDDLQNFESSLVDVKCIPNLVYLDSRSPTLMNNMSYHHQQNQVLINQPNVTQGHHYSPPFG